ncbi:hypothetical protein [Xanthomonas graminis]|uniref:hypothetical protein n=1 Tax=Xanthomonas graminis TaxID=3390026 RepID=UPI001187600F|nr:hypothetical protein [Xanthomonas translucens]UKE64514.1 hypothetical protein KM547_12055 [Xanthomonas translucens pv. phlei]
MNISTIFLSLVYNGARKEEDTDSEQLGGESFHQHDSARIACSDRAFFFSRSASVTIAAIHGSCNPVNAALPQTFIRVHNRLQARAAKEECAAVDHESTPATLPKL